jgi:tetratricopeptide (TPR) repeat protein
MAMIGDPLRRWKTAGFIASLAIVLTLPVYTVKEKLRRGRLPLADATAASFVGRESCVDCHQAASEAWLGSDHDNAMAIASDSSVRGDFDDAVFEGDGISARFYTRDGTYYVNTQGPDGEPTEFEIAYTFGVEPLQQYLIPFPGGRLQSLTIAWDTERQQWFYLYAGEEIPFDDWLHWTQGAQNWNGMCAECHSTNLVKGYDFYTRTFSTTWSEIDVSCEACHGPGSLHVDWAEDPPMARSAIESYGLAIPSVGITSRQQVELCAPCHSRRTELGDYDHRRADLLDNIQPTVLDEGLYHADGQILEEVYVYGSFVQSKMFKNDVRCGDCHDVHSLQLLFDGNELCAQCHRVDTYDSYEHHFHEKVVDGEPSDGALCVKCHMPEQPYMVVDWRADHSIRVPRPDLTLEIGVPNACSQSGCHDDETDQWNAEHYQEWYGIAKKPHYGTIIEAGRRRDPSAQPDLIRLSGDALYPAIVRATALSLLGAYPGEESTAAFNLALQDEEALVRFMAVSSVDPVAAEELVELVAPLLFDPVRGVRMQAASRLAGLPAGLFEPYQQEALEGATAEYRQAMEYSLDFAFAGHNLGNLYSRLGESERAATYYRAAIEVDDLFYPAKTNLAVLLNSMGRNDEAETLLREVLEEYPDVHDVAYSLGLLLAEMGRMDEAIEYLGRASDSMPQSSRVHYNYGLALQSLGRDAEAEAALLRALDVEPESLDYLFAVADFYVKRLRLREALPFVDRMIAAHPEDSVGRDLKTYIEQALGSPGRN